MASAGASTQGEQVLSASGEYVVASGQGGGATARWSLGLDDYWNVTVDLGWAQLVDETEDGDSHRLGGSVGVLYHLDAFAWVPYLVFAIEGDGLFDNGGTRSGLGFEFGGGLDYRPGRRFGVGAYALWHAMVYGDIDPFTSYGVRLNAYF